MKKIFLFYIAIALSSISYAQNYQYLGDYTANGTPLYLESPGDNITTEIMELVDNSLSETFQVPTYNPHYITSDYETNIIITEETEVFITYIHECAGFRNVLGYYTYDVNNPPTTAPTDEEVTIIFPNISEVGSGGGLQPGDKVSLGTHPAGTGIGWVLLSDGWNGEQVEYGYWQFYSNPDFNPEPNESDRYHNVQIKDDTNELVILGFEEIRRDHPWSDNDFNDALFYITATDYSAIDTNNLIDSSSSTDVYSANLGGFESNGDLANQVAKRNFDRLKSKNYADQKKKQKMFTKNALKNNDLGNYFPETGLYATESPFISTSLDLVNYANAKDVFSIDYYIEENRVSAGLVTTTSGQIYNHAKTICDRLNGSTLKDVRQVTIKDHDMIFAIIERHNGDIEYAISFSIRENGDNHELFSLWNVDDYPEGNYKNFQIWGKSMAQVVHIINYTLEKLSHEKNIASYHVDHRAPTVFVSAARYRNKELHLDIINKIGAQNATITSNIKRTELSELEEFSDQVPLSGEWHDQIVVETGFLFDIGLSFEDNLSDKSDALYLADGPWGIDYIAEDTTIDKFVINEQESDLDPAIYQLERSSNASGTLKGTCNLFRTFLPGDLSLKTKDYESIMFTIQNNLPIEVILVPSNLEDWNNRLRYYIPANSSNTDYTIRFDEFTNAAGVFEEINDLRSVIFSMHNGTETPVSFSIDIHKLGLGINPESLLGTLANQSKAINYPNPFTDYTIVTVPQKTSNIDLHVYDLFGRKIYNSMLKTMEDEKSVKFDPTNLNLAKGLYTYIALYNERERATGSFLIQ